MSYNRFHDESERELELETVRRANNQLENLENHVAWKLAPLKIIQRVTLFLTNLKYASATYRFKLLRREIFRLISDKSSIFNYYLNNDMLILKPTRFQRIKYALQQSDSWLFQLMTFIRKDSTVLLPADRFLFFWDLMLMILSVVNIFYVPFALSFEVNHSELGGMSLLFSVIPSCVFLIDLFLSFFKGYYHRGILHTSKSEIFWHYVKGDFLLDLFIVIPFILTWFGIMFANYLMLIRITRVKRMLKNIEEIANFSEKSAVAYQLFCLVYSLLLISHICACLFHYLAQWETSNGYSHTWLHAQNILDADSTIRYVNSLYWISITSMTVGYGDIVPVTVPEKILVTMVTYFVTGFFGYALSMIQSIFSKLQEQQDKNNAKLRLVNHHIRQRGLNSQLQFRVRKYFQYYLEFKQEEELDIDELMGQLNPQLKKEVQQDMYGHILQNTKILGNLPQKVLQKLSLHLHERTFAPEEEIVNKSDIPNKMYIVLNGHVASYFNDKNIKTYRRGQIICEKEFYLQEHMAFNLKALTFVQVAYLSYDKFLEIITLEQESYELYRQQIDGGIREAIICEVCKATHPFHSCSLVFCQITRDKVIAAFNKTFDQKRKRFKRKVQRKEDVLKFSIDVIRKKAVEQMLAVQQKKQFKFSDDKLIAYGLIREEHQISQTSRRKTIIYSDRILDEEIDNKKETGFDNFQIDRVTEYKLYFPYCNISKVMLLLNKKKLYDRVLSKIRQRNTFGTFMSRQILQRII